MPIKTTVETEGDDAASPQGGETAPLDNVSRLHTHLKADSLALKLLEAWTGAEPEKAKPALLKAVDDHFSEKK